MQGRPLGYPDYPQSLFFEQMILIPISSVSDSEPKPIEPKTFDPNKPYQRRDGKTCKIVHTTKEGKFVVVTPETDAVYYCHANGYYLSTEHDGDLVNIPEKIEGWLNVYKNNKVYANKSMADDVGYDRIACIPVSFTKGAGLKNE